jgi:CHRD domain-containing protein
MRTNRTRIAGGAIAAGLAVTGLVGGPALGNHNGGVKLRAKLTGANEVPGPADPDGTGKAKIRLKAKKGKVCFRLRWEDIAEPTAAHIHTGAAGVAGDVVVPLFVPPAAPTHRGCVTGVDHDLIRDIRRHPSEYYVNIHTGEFPNGAIRGQLSKLKKHRHGQHHPHP